MNYDEALAKVQNKIGADYMVTSVETRPYGWMFWYCFRSYVETGDPGKTLIGGGPVFVSKTGEVCDVPGMFPTSLFFKSWQVAHPEYELPKFEWSSPEEFSAELDEAEESYIMRLVNTILVDAINGKANKVRIASQPNKFYFRVLHCLNGVWHEETKTCYYALVAQRIKQMAEIEPRNKECFDAAQSGTINVTLKDENYLVAVTATIVEHCEHLSLHIQPQQ